MQMFMLTYCFSIRHQPADVVTHKGANGDVTGAAHTPASPVCSLEHLQRQLQPSGHHPVLLVLARVLGQLG